MTKLDEAKKIKAEIEELKKKTKILEAKPAKKVTKKAAKPAKKVTKKAAKPAKKVTKKEAKPAKKVTKKEAKPAKKVTKKEAKPAKKVTKKEEVKPTKPKKLTKKELEEEKRIAERTVEDELEEQLTEEEIENFQIEKVDMERLTNKICDILAEKESDGMLQSELWKKLKLSSRDGSRLSLKLERMGTINREKLLENDRWTYKLILKKTPISTQSIENSPCLVCTVEQKCSLDGEISPKTCQLIEDWVIAEYKKPSKAKK
ncbi:MAG: transcriptional regulator [Nitrosopumilus sp.]